MTKTSTTIFVNGITGRMGQELANAIQESNGLALVGGASSGYCLTSSETQEPLGSSIHQQLLSGAELLIDFSSSAGTKSMLESVDRLGSKGKAILICSTGLDQSSTDLIKKLSIDHRILVAPNTSIGILILRRLNQLAVELCSRFKFDIEIIETHHSGKRDAPSGTAIQLADDIRSAQTHLAIRNGHTGLRKTDELGMHAIRGGGVFGEHTIRFLGANEEISLNHRAYKRELFAQGALALGRWLIQQSPGLYQTDDYTKTL